MKDYFDIFAYLSAGVVIADVAADQMEVRMIPKGLEILFFSRGEVVETDHMGAFGKKRFDEVGTDESGTAGDKDVFSVHSRPSEDSFGRMPLMSKMTHPRLRNCEKSSSLNCRCATARTTAE